ncbi:Fc.00g017480.m01.CDS01 [Cosmosporella sp. VM-42]
MEFIPAKSPNRAGYDWLDTPGFDDANRSDTDVLKEIAPGPKMTHMSDIKLRGILYLHQIPDDRILGSAKRNILMFNKLCRQGALKRVILATPRWDEVGKK